MSVEVGTEVARTRPSFAGSVTAGRRVAVLPSRVGTRARVPREACGR